MEKLKTAFSIFLIGALIYLYIEDIPYLTKKVEHYIFHNTSLIKALYSPLKHTEFSQSNDMKRNGQEEADFSKEKEDYIESKNSRYSKNTEDIYERKAEEEIDKLLELK